MAATNNSSSYAGKDTLEELDGANNYINSIIALILHHCDAEEEDVHLVDFGAGIGSYAERLQKKDRTVSCIEPDVDCQSVIAQKGLPVYSSLQEFQHGFVEKKKFVYSLNVLEHIANDSEIISSLHENLQEGEKLLLYLPAFMILYSRFDRRVGHYRRYRGPKLIEMLQEHGFVVERCQYMDSIGFFVALLFKLIFNSSRGPSKMAIRVFDQLLFPLNRLLDPLLGRWLGKNLVVVAVKS